MQPLLIVWQRLVNALGHTCPRCVGTGQALQRAVERLRPMLEPLGISPVLEVRAIDVQGFVAQPSESNRIWVAGRPLEDWLGGQTGSSRCCNECGDQVCRTLELGGQTHEVVPEELLVRAGLKAGLGLLEPEPADTLPAGSGLLCSRCGSGGCCY